MCINEMGDYMCNCISGFYGKNCESDFNECFSLLCMYGGSCIDIIGGFCCDCILNFFGDKC